jgi:hypothetical protein
VQYLRRLCELSNVRLLILSRRELILERHITTSICSTDSMFDMASYNSSDIQLFIDLRISKLSEAKPVLAEMQERIRSFITKESRGMFQWVKLVIEQLEFEEGDSHDITKALERFPTDLNEAYQKTFDRLSKVPGYNKSRAVVALKWLACAKRALTLYELRTAIEIQEKLGKVSKPNPEAIENIVSAVSKIDETTLEKYFIALLGPLAEFHRRSALVNVVDTFGNYRGAPTVILICHHSLTQLLISTSQPEGFHFNGKISHLLAAETCMKMMCDRNAIRNFLERYYVPADGCGDGSVPLMDYAVEYWSAHLRASGVRHMESDLTDLTLYTITQSLDLSMLLMGALSDACTRLNGAKVGQMMQAIAIRDCQKAILPSVNLVVTMRQSLPKFVIGLRKINIELHGLGRLEDSTAPKDTANQESTGELNELTLNGELDSSLMIAIFQAVDADPDRFKPVKAHLELVRETSRKIRALTIKLSADPIRTWLSHQIGDHGISPTPTLALTTHALDILLAAFLLPSSTYDRTDFRDQFAAKKDHPLYGFIAATGNELRERGRNVLTAADYKDYILDHYLLRRFEWYSLYITTAILETNSSGGGSYFVNRLIRDWHTNSLMIYYNEDDPSMRASMLFLRHSPRQYKEAAVTAAEGLLHVLTVVLVIFAKTLTLISPQIEEILVQVINQVATKGIIMKPWFESLVQGWRHSSIALPLYLLRLNYFFWLFAYPRKTPWTDLKGIIDDPFNYKSKFQQYPWTLIILLIAQEMVVSALVMYDIFQYVERVTAATDADEDAPPSLYRRISFRISPLGSSTTENVIEVLSDTLPHAREILMFVARMIFIERTIFEVSYILFDIIQITAQLLTPESWSWSLVIQATSGIVGQIIAAVLNQAVGPLGIIVLGFQIYLCVKIWGWLRIGFVFKFLFRHTIALPALWTWRVIKFPFVTLFTIISWCTLSFAQLIVQIAHMMGPRATVLVTAGFLILFFGFILLLMTDPMQLRHAAFACGRARRVAAKSTGVHDPLRALNWRAGNLKRIKSVSLVDLNHLGKRLRSHQTILKTVC